MSDYTVTVKTQPAGYYDGAFQVGHAFVTLRAPGRPDVTIGYYPIVPGAYGAGTVRNDTLTEVVNNVPQEHLYTWSRTFIVSERQYSNMLSYAASVAIDSHDNYDGRSGIASLLVAPLSLIVGSLSNVCTDFVRNMLASGEILPTPVVGKVFDNMLPQNINLQYGQVPTNQFQPGNVVAGSLSGQIDASTQTLWGGIHASDPYYANWLPNTGGPGLPFTTGHFGANGTVLTFSNGVQYMADPDHGIFTWIVPNPSTGKWVTTSENKITGVVTVTESPLNNHATVTQGYSSKSMGNGTVLVSVLGLQGTPTGETYTKDSYSLAAEGASAGYSITAATNNATGVSTYQLKDANGNPVASGSSYSVAQNNTISFDAGTSKQIYDLNTGRMVAQVDANGAGFLVDPARAGNDIHYAAGQISYNTNSGVLSATVGGQATSFFGIVNSFDQINTTTTSAATPGTLDGTNSVSANGSTLVNNANSSIYSLLGNVNTAGSNAAIFNYGITDGLRPGNSNLGLNIDASSGVGLKPPTSAGSGGTDPYSLFGTTLNNSANSNFALTATDPLVLDLNGDGVKLTNYTDSPVLFDADNDGGSLEQTGWVSNADGIVVHDLNGDGKINNIRETLSEYYNGVAGSNGVAGAKPYANGFAALKSLDSNADNQFTSADAAWSILRVWVDANHDGKTDAGELKTFAQLGITSINLNSTGQSGEVRDGNEVLASGTFTHNGLTREAIAANFLANPAGSTVTASGTGIIVTTESLATAAGNTGVTAAFVSQNTHAGTNEALTAATLAVKNITGGAGADTITGDAQNNWIAGGLGADKLYGGAGDDVLLMDAADTIIDGGAGLDIAQVVGGTLGQKGVTLNLSLSNIEIAVGGDGNDVFIGGGRSSVFIRGGAGDDMIIGGAANDVLSGEDGSDLIDGGAGNDLIRGHRGQDQLLGGAGDDVLDGGLEDDILSGGAGNDVLIGGCGDDRIDGGDGIDVARYSGSYADYRITKVSDANGVNTLRVVDTRTGQDGADTLTNVEKLSFSDVSRVDLSLGSPLPVKDILSVNSSGLALSRTVPHLLSQNQLLANDRDWDSDTSQLSITTVLEAKGGTASLTAQGDVLFTPNAGYTGVMSFKYTVKDAQGNFTQVTNSASGQTATMMAAVYLQTPDLPSDPLAMQQWYLSDTNVIAAWGTAAEQVAGQGYSGKGVRIGQFEPGGPYSTGPEVFDYRHPDLQQNADKAWLNSLDANGNSDVAQAFSSHATMVAGVMVAARNGQGGVGVAYNATLAGEYIKGENLEISQLQAEITSALAKFKTYDVVNNSWGATANFHINVVPTGTLQAGILDAVLSGRGGLGTVIVMAGGNDRATGANTNTNALTANGAVITTGSINAPGDLGTLQLGSKPFSNLGASILVSAPGSNINSTSRELIADNGSTFGSDYNMAQGTSFAAPIVSGIVALMLEANARLGYRDVQAILAMSATKVDDPNGTDWVYNTARNWNGGGMHASHDYGFGKVDARAAVRLAESWYDTSTAYNQQNKTASSGTLNAAIPDGASVLTRTLSMAAGMDVESAQVTLQLDHQRWGDLIVKLVSPTGTESILVNRPGKAPGSAVSDLGDASAGLLDFSFNTTHVRGEASGGNWTLQVIDAAPGNVGQLKNWKLDLYGASADSDDVYVYTNEFASIAGRIALTDTNAGSDIINASAVTGNSTINLNNGTASTIAGKTLTLNGDIEKAFGGDGNDILTGNSQMNVLLGGRGSDVLHGGAGYDRLEGGYGNDTLTGGTENDLFVFRKDAGSTDTITDFNVASGVEKIAIVGFHGVTDATQLTFIQVGANVQIGLGQSQFILVNGTTVAQLSEQNFVFISDASFVDEYARRWANPALWTGTAGVENGLLPGNLGDLNAVGLGDDDVLGAVTANDLIDGGNGNDTIWGDYPGYTPVPGADWIAGGAGNDVLRGGPGGDWLVGGSGNDALFGEDGDDYLIGNTGADYLDGGAGDDIITLDGDVCTVEGTTVGYDGRRVGGAGADVFRVLVNGGGVPGLTVSGGQINVPNLIADFDPSQPGEKIDLRAFDWIHGVGDLAFQSMLFNGVQFTRVSVENGSASLNLNIRGVGPTQLNANHFAFAPGIQVAIKGTSGNDTLTGDAGANTLDGFTGADSMTGRTGDDTYLVDNPGDMVNEFPGGGFDTVQSSVTYTLSSDVEALILLGTANLNATGNAQRNRLTGNAGSNRFDGGAEADDMAGGAGNDTYVVDNQLDTVFEKVGEGIDNVEAAVSWTLGAHFENLMLTGGANINGTGNDAANTLTGNAGDNILDGAQGADAMAGGLGNDTYYVDNASDTVTEALNAGIDMVYASVNLSLSANVENGALFGAAITLSGNTLDNTLLGSSLANTLAGGAGNDVLDGGAGADAMLGGLGDDVYFVDNAGDVVIENAGEGRDTVVASLTYILAANVEDLLLSGTAAINGTGNALDNQLTGNGASNSLTGGAGNDVLTGGSGNDLLDGGDGFDTAVFQGQRSSYAVARGPLSVTITGADGSDVLTRVEKLQFDDLTLLLRPADQDFDGDGKSDILWRNSSTGADTIWKSGNSATQLAVATETNQAWQVAGVGDFQGDGKADVLWRHATTGQTYLYNSGNAATGGFLGTVSDLNWKVVGIGDFDGDGKSDILWRNTSTGANTIWKAGVSTSLQTVATEANQAWQVVGVGDFQGDGNADILWRHATTGQTYLYNSGSAATGQLLGTVSDLNWKVVGVGDFDGDGKSDILWRNTGTGANTIWKAGVSTSLQTVATEANQAWQVVGVGDFQGDGRADILWRNATTGQTYLYNSGSAATGQLLGTVADLNWSVVDGLETGDLLGGGAGANTLVGTVNADVIFGGAGNDTLTGGRGADLFRYTGANQGVDSITDFTPGIDKIQVVGSAFGNLPAGALQAGKWVAGVSPAANQAAAQFLYNTVTGMLAFDVDGTGAAAPLNLVSLVGQPAIAAADVLVTVI